MSGVFMRAHNINMKFGLHSESGGLLKPQSATSSLMALDNISFELNSGDRVGILGANGAGKSTLLKIVSDVLRPTSGQIQSNGKKMSLLDLNADVIPQASCVQNIHLRGYSLGLKRHQIHDFEKYVRSKADLEKFIHSPVSVLSAGMKTRLLVSMIGYLKSEILIMDEWIGTTDTSFYEKSNGVLHGLISHSDIFLLASHNRRIIEQLCTKVLVLNNGRLEYQGSTDQGFLVLEKCLKKSR